MPSEVMPQFDGLGSLRVSDVCRQQDASLANALSRRAMGNATATGLRCVMGDRNRHWHELVTRYAEAWDPRDGDSYDVASSVVAGARGAGKTTFLDCYYVHPALEAGVYQKVIDPGVSLAIKAAGRALWYGHRESCLVDDLSEPGYGLGIPVIRRDDSADEDERVSRNDAFAAAFAFALCMMAVGDPDLLITVDQWATFSANFWQWQRDRLPEWYVFYALEPDARPFREMLAGCTNEDVRLQADHLVRMYARNYGEYLKNVQATLRRVQRIRRAPGVRNRQWDGTGHVRDAIRNGGMLCLILNKNGKADERVQRFLALLWDAWHIEEAGRLWSENLCPTPMQHVTDEAFSNLLCNRMTITSASEQRKHGVNWVWAGPSATTGDEVLDGQLWGITDEQVALRLNSYEEAERFSKSTARLDPLKVKRLRSRRRTVVEYQEIESISTGRSIDYEGRERTDERIAKVWRPTPREVVDTEEDLYQLGEQVMLNTQALMSQPKGWFTRRLYGVVSGPDYFEPSGDPWDGAGPEIVAEHRRWLKESGILRGVQSGSSRLNAPGNPPAKPKPPRIPSDHERRRSTRNGRSGTSNGSH